MNQNFDQQSSLSVLNAADNALLQHNNALYAPQTSIVDTAFLCKKYIEG